MTRQIVSIYDPLKSFKEDAYQRFHTCSFFEHNVNQTTNINVGEYNGTLVKEKIITDGKISLRKKNEYQPSVIWQNVFVTLENGLSINIEIKDATFMISIIQFGDKKEHEIHIIEEDKSSLQTILNFLYKNQQIDNLSSISFKSPSILVLESTINNNTKKETIDFKTGKSKIKHKTNK